VILIWLCIATQQCTYSQCFNSWEFKAAENNYNWWCSSFWLYPPNYWHQLQVISGTWFKQMCWSDQQGNCARSICLWLFEDAWFDLLLVHLSCSNLYYSKLLSKPCQSEARMLRYGDWELSLSTWIKLLASRRAWSYWLL